MQLIAKLRDKIKSYPNKDNIKHSTIIVSKNEQILGERPSISFAKLWDYYCTDPTIQNAINSLRDQIVGSGFYVTANDPKAVEIINEFCNRLDLDNLLYDIVGEMLICGNSFVEMLTSDYLEDLVRVQITTIKRIIRDEYGNTRAIVQEFDGVENYLNPNNFIHFKLFDVNGKPFGIGLFNALAVPQLIDGELRPSIIDSIASIRDSMVRIFDAYASPKDIYIFENASEQFLQEQAQKIKSMKKGQSFITNKRFEHKEITIDPRSRFDKYVEFLQTQLELGSQTPAAKLQTTTGYTEASASAVIELVERRVVGMQRRLKRIIEKEIFNRVLLREGFDIKQVNLELHWGLPDIPSFNTQDIFKAVELGVISVKEARSILQRSGWILDPNEVI